MCTDQTEDEAGQRSGVFLATLSSENPWLTPLTEALAAALRETPSNKKLQRAACRLFSGGCKQARYGLRGAYVHVCAHRVESGRAEWACACAFRVCVEVCVCGVCTLTSRPLNFAWSKHWWEESGLYMDLPSSWAERAVRAGTGP